MKLSPGVRAMPLATAIPTIPIDAIRQFLTETYVVEEGELNRAPYIVDFSDEHVVAGAGNRIYVRSIPDALNRRFTVCHWRYGGAVGRACPGAPANPVASASRIV